MAATTRPRGSFTLAVDLTVTRRGDGAARVAGPHVFVRAAAVAVGRGDRAR